MSKKLHLHVFMFTAYSGTNNFNKVYNFTLWQFQMFWYFQFIPKVKPIFLHTWVNFLQIMQKFSHKFSRNFNDIDRNRPASMMPKDGTENAG